jgi:hypothetical protein
MDDETFLEFDISHVSGKYLKLIEKYPRVFLEPNSYVQEKLKNKSIKYKTCNLRYGFEHEEGWFDILDEFLTKCNEIQLFDSEYYKACICKEKFGTLHWQSEYYFECKDKTKKYFNLINELNKKSEIVCELTGKKGYPCYINGWRKTYNEDIIINSKYKFVNKTDERNCKINLYKT